MALTKDKLVTRLQDQLGMSKQEVSPDSGTALGDNEGHLGPGRRTAHHQVWKILGKAEKSTSGEKLPN
jgi:hypothetical protein